jgi:hypothetical protein
MRDTTNTTKARDDEDAVAERERGPWGSAKGRRLAWCLAPPEALTPPMRAALAIRRLSFFFRAPSAFPGALASPAPSNDFEFTGPRMRVRCDEGLEGAPET